MNLGDANPVALAASPLQAQLTFARDANGATYVDRQRVGYPFHVGRRLSMPGDPPGMPTIYLQSCSGGIFEGDDLGLRIEAGENSAAHVSTGAATVVHSMETEAASQRTHVELRAGAYFEYLPDPLILFPRARLATAMRVVVHPGAVAIFGDA
ncbi:MAG TPA: urease accessory protein UreD, partial [Burkholderiales bacterium]|nr:urease accessory protein UreD [Burkholderiales bacterium]